MSQRSTASPKIAVTDIALVRNIDVIGEKLAKLESRLACSNRAARDAFSADNERDLRRMVDLFPQPAIVHAGGTIVHANPGALRCCRAVGIQKLLGVPYLSLIHPDYRSLMKVRMASLSSRPEREDSANVIALDIGGAEYPASIRMVSVMWRGEAAVLSIFREGAEAGSSDDVGETQWEPVGLDDWVWIWQADTGAVHVGPGLRKWFGGDDIPAVRGYAGWDTLVHDEDLPTLHDALRKCAEGEDAEFAAELRLKSQGASPCWVRLTGRALRGANGKFDRVTGVADDLSRFKDLEARLAARGRELEKSRRALTSRTAALVAREDELDQARRLVDSADGELAAREEELADTQRALQLRTSELALRWAELQEIHQIREDLRAELERCEDRLRAKTSNAAELETELSLAREQTVARDKDLATRDAKIDELRQGLVSRKADLADLQSRLVDLGARLASREADLSARDADLRRCQEALRSRTAVLLSLKKDLALANDDLETGRSALAERDAALATHAAELADREAELAQTQDLARRQASEVAKLQDDLKAAQSASEARSREVSDRREEISRIKRVLETCAEQLSAREEALAQNRAMLESRTRELAARSEELAKARDRIDGQETAIRELRGAANHLENVQSQFLAGVSHELLTPLNAIKGFAEVIHEEMFGALDAPQYRDYAGDIVSSADQLRAMIGDLLELSRIGARKADIREETLDVVELVGEGLRRVTPRAEQAGIGIRANIPEGLPRLRADRHMTRQMLLNLLTHAIDFAREGGSIEAAALVAEDGGLSLAVRDTGSGRPGLVLNGDTIALDDLQTGVSTAHWGNGLRLSLARDLIHLHGGRLEIDPAPEAGITAILRFPADRTVR